MSIRINDEKCVGCLRCVEACPGNLIKADEWGKAHICHVQDCWGCTSCLKECRSGAIEFFLGADIGGMGSRLSVRERGDYRTWIVTKSDGSSKEIQINKKESNKY